MDTIKDIIHQIEVTRNVTGAYIQNEETNSVDISQLKNTLSRFTSFPDELGELLLVKNGDMEGSTGLLEDDLYLLSALEIENIFLRNIEFGSDTTMEFLDTGIRSHTNPYKYWIPFVNDDGMYFFVDTKPTQGGVNCQVIYCQMDSAAVYVVAPSIRKYLEYYSIALSKGLANPFQNWRRAVDDPTVEPHLFLLNSSI